ncbi:hypothetical protein GJV82_07020 [Cellulosimicrobium sp. BIT-GX5]|uniref:Chitin-binding type-3 domain-containing protein n=1 Tax=Cellulosimicrobium composti TaxID=2672572 RepID=A0A6N7ZGX1_9MICO|nr:carbohydrate-binding protein [Cellulosimicrobium composti]MTG88697.1 hypothetical protein [Cellulosimicrobium composti]
MSHQGKEYRAKWGTQGDVPTAGGPGELTGAGSGDPTDPSDTTDPTDPGECTAAAWSPTAVYTGGATVSYQGQTFRAKWWTQNNVPGAEQYGPWESLGAC